MSSPTIPIDPASSAKNAPRTLVVHCKIDPLEDASKHEEFQLLAKSAGAEIIETLIVNPSAPNPRYFIGSGKAETLKALVALHKIDLVLIDHPLTPTQERNLERLIQCRCLERSGLILDIFAQRAQTFEGKLQVELAQLKHLSTRLVRGWTHLERQKGGIGLRGPGETQLETDRRLIGGRIKAITKRLEKVRQRRGLLRGSRKKFDIPSISLIGYTNAGKSTLFNRLTAANTLVKDQLFATLDPTTRALNLPGLGDILLSDTVGFVQDLPHTLIEAFRATLEETTEAECLLHVIDANDPNRAQKQKQVNKILTEIGAHKIPQIEVMNKIDQSPNLSPHYERATPNHPDRVWLSAKKNTGIEKLIDVIKHQIEDAWLHTVISLPPEKSALRAKLYALGAIKNETTDDEGNMHLEIYLPRKKYQMLFDGKLS